MPILRALAFAGAFTAAAPAFAQDTGSGIDVHIRLSDMSEDYVKAPQPFSFAVSRVKLVYVLSANGNGMLASQRIGNDPQTINETFAPGQEPRGFTLAKGRNGQPQLRIWAQGLPREATVNARFVKGDWDALAAGRRVTLTASVRDVQRAHGVAAQLGKSVTAWLRQRFENAIPFMTIQIGELSLRRMDLSSENVVIDGTSKRLLVTYPDGELSYSAPVSMGR